MRKSSSSATGSSTAGSSATTTSRLPFRPRDVNTYPRAESVTSLGSKASSGFSGGSGLSKGTNGGSNSSSLTNKFLHSYLESSNNPNNQRLSSSDIDPTGQGQQQQQPAHDSSTVANAGGGIKIPLLSSSSSSKAAAAAASSPATSTAAATAAANAAAAAAAPKPKSSSSSSRQKPQVVPEDHEEIEIVEHRKKASGDGYTVHRYIRGRLLGKGGFAKVYWCTSLDTNRHYAVKIVPKANLVKSRARQKLQAEIKIHRSLKHDNVCEYKHFFEDKVNCYILLELCHNHSCNEMIKRRKSLTEEETRLLNLQCEKYETLIDDAEYVTHEQRSTLKARKREIEKLSDAIEKAQSSGLFGQLDRMCNAAGSVAVVSGNSLVEENETS